MAEYWADTVPPSVVKGVKAASSKGVKRQELIYEFVKTEKGFFRDLVAFKTIFKQEIIDSKLLSNDDIAILFRNLDDVIAQSGQFRLH